MIDFEEMKRCREEGSQAIASLEGDERDILKHFCSLLTEALLRLGVQRKAPVDEVVISAFINGIALGLRLSIINGEVQVRK